MLKIEGQKISISQGDTVNLGFRLEGYSLEVDDTIRFSVKADPSKQETLIVKEFSGLEGDGFIIRLSPEETKIPAGTNYWDMTCTTAAGGHFTLNYPAPFIVREVVHND